MGVERVCGCDSCKGTGSARMGPRQRGCEEGLERGGEDIVVVVEGHDVCGFPIAE